MTAEEFNKKFIKKFKLDMKGVIAYINQLEKCIERLKRGDKEC